MCNPVNYDNGHNPLAHPLAASVCGLYPRTLRTSKTRIPTPKTRSFIIYKADSKRTRRWRLGKSRSTKFGKFAGIQPVWKIRRISGRVRVLSFVEFFYFLFFFFCLWRKGNSLKFKVSARLFAVDLWASRILLLDFSSRKTLEHGPSFIIREESFSLRADFLRRHFLFKTNVRIKKRGVSFARFFLCEKKFLCLILFAVHVSTYNTMKNKYIIKIACNIIMTDPKNYLEWLLI